MLANEFLSLLPPEHFSTIYSLLWSLPWLELFLCNSNKQPLNHTHSSPPPIEPSHVVRMVFKKLTFTMSLPCLQIWLPWGITVLMKKIYNPCHGAQGPTWTGFHFSLSACSHLLTSTLTFLVSKMLQSSFPHPPQDLYVCSFFSLEPSTFYPPLSSPPYPCTA